MRILLLLLLLAGSANAQSYLILSQNSTNYALAVSAKIWKLASPDADTNSKKTTKYWTEFVKHADGRVALVIPAIDTLKLAEDADSEDLPNSLTGILTPQAIAKIKTDIVANRGKAVSVSQFVPLEKLGNVRTKAQMTADGWFP